MTACFLLHFVANEIVAYKFRQGRAGHVNLPKWLCRCGPIFVEAKVTEESVHVIQLPVAPATAACLSPEFRNHFAERGSPAANGQVSRAVRPSMNPWMLLSQKLGCLLNLLFSRLMEVVVDDA